MAEALGIGVITALLAVWIGAELYLAEKKRKQIVEEEAPRPNTEESSDE